jgi:hypothetical protein
MSSRFKRDGGLCRRLLHELQKLAETMAIGTDRVRTRLSRRQRSRSPPRPKTSWKH